jgi:hypothetical protein
MPNTPKILAAFDLMQEILLHLSDGRCLQGHVNSGAFPDCIWFSPTEPSADNGWSMECIAVEHIVSAVQHKEAAAP